MPFSFCVIGLRKWAFLYKYMNECLCTVSAPCIRCWKEGDISDSCSSGNTSSKTGTTHFLSVQCRFLHNFAASRNVLSHGFFPTGWITRSLRTPWPWWRCPTLRTPRCPSTGRPSFSETSGQSKNIVAGRKKNSQTGSEFVAKSGDKKTASLAGILLVFLLDCI
jgi:hypothetical protein